MSNSGWFDSTKNCTVLKLHDMCHNPKCNCQKHITFTPKQYMLEGIGFVNTMEKKIANSLKYTSQASSNCTSTAYWYGCK